MKLINIDTGTGRILLPVQELKLKDAIWHGKLSIDLGEAQDIDGDICLSDDDYVAAMGVLS